MMMTRRLLKVSLVAVLLLATGACAGDAGQNWDSDHGDSAFPQVWDLTRPPTRDAVQMTEGDDTVFFELQMDSPQDVTFRLPEDHSFTVPLYLVAFDSLGNVAAGDSAPTGLDGRTGRMSLDQTVALYRALLEQLDIETAAVSKFSDEAHAARNSSQGPGPYNNRINSELISRQFGYLNFKVLATYRTRVDQGLLRVMGSWNW